MLWSLAAGPLVNAALMPILYGAVLMSGSLGWAQSMPNAYQFLATIQFINMWLLIFNMMPVYPLDGGQILRSLLWYAAYALDAEPKEAPRAAAMAKARLSEIYSRTTDRAVLMHGGIGFTWEHDIHLWFKRSRFDESYFGSPPYHRERVAQLGGY